MTVEERELLLRCAKAMVAIMKTEYILSVKRRLDERGTKTTETEIEKTVREEVELMEELVETVELVGYL